MLASDEEGGTLDALRFSLASDIVELVVLTGDEAFLQTLREAVGGSRRLWHVPSADKVSDLLVAGEVGILVLDVLALQRSPVGVHLADQAAVSRPCCRGRRQSGCGDSRSPALISAGTVYRFIHKPMSPGRAKLFADAAVKKYDEQRRRTASTPVVTRKGPGPGPLDRRRRRCTGRSHRDGLAQSKGARRKPARRRMLSRVHPHSNPRCWARPRRHLPPIA